MGKVLGVMCHKGGAGKTSTVFSLASLFAKSNYKTLVIDSDEQGNIKTLYSLRTSDSDGGLGSILINKLTPSTMIRQTGQENLSVLLSGGRTIRDFEESSFQDKDKLSLMANMCKDLKNDYDIILIDTPPAIGAISVNVATFCDYVLLVSEPDLLGSMGARSTETFITKDIGDKLGLRTPKILGVVFTRYDSRRTIDIDAIDEMEQYASKGHLGGGKVFNPIRQDTKLRTAQARRKSIFDYAPKSKAAKDYFDLGVEILELMKINNKKLTSMENELLS